MSNEKNAITKVEVEEANGRAKAKKVITDFTEGMLYDAKPRLKKMSTDYADMFWDWLIDVITKQLSA